MEQKSILKNIFSPFLENCGHGRGGLWFDARLDKGPHKKTG
jgi:hypothetical protein